MHLLKYKIYCSYLLSKLLPTTVSCRIVTGQTIYSSEPLIVRTCFIVQGNERQWINLAVKFNIFLYT